MLPVSWGDSVWCLQVASSVSTTGSWHQNKSSFFANRQREDFHAVWWRCPPPLPFHIKLVRCYRNPAMISGRLLYDIVHGWSAACGRWFGDRVAHRCRADSARRWYFGCSTTFARRRSFCVKCRSARPQASLTCGIESCRDAGTGRNSMSFCHLEVGWPNQGYGNDSCIFDPFGFKWQPRKSREQVCPVKLVGRARRSACTSSRIG